MANIDERLSFYVANEFGLSDGDLLPDISSPELDSVIKACVLKAYQDEKRRIPYRYSTEKLKELNKKKVAEYNSQKQAFYEAIEKVILSELITGGRLNCKRLNPSILITKVKKTALRYRELFKPEKVFTIGLSQKWVNMTIKYLWILGIFDDEYENLIDVPIDKYIISSLKKLEIKAPADWSTWDNLKEYMQIQEKLKEVLEKDAFTRISWENDAWVTMKINQKNPMGKTCKSYYESVVRKS